MKKIGKFLYKNRDKTGIPFFIIILFFINPNVKNFFLSLPLLILGELLRIYSLMYAGESTRAKDLKANFLVTGGPYAFLRNPIYLGNFFISLSIMIFYNPPLYFFLLFIFLFFLQYFLIVLEEENFLEKEFGEEYKSYKKNTYRFFPKLKPYSKRTKKLYNFLEVFKFEKSTIFLILFLILLGFLIIYLK
ncbi:MAG: methyltransferase [candidate division WOR-3 bacterium]